MKWSPGEWEKDIERLVNQCADKVILELEEAIMARLREAGEVVIQGIFQDQAFQAAPQVQISKVINAPQVSTVDDFGEVLYAFGIIKADQEVTVDLLGLEDRPCRIIENGNLGMLVCPVPRQEYTEESLHRYMEDMAWVENHARRHEEILLKTMGGRSIIPLPFCTIFTDEVNVRRQLTQNAERLQADLQRLENHQEMQVKLLVNRKRLLEKLQEDCPYSGEQNGGGYFQKRQWEKRLKEELEQLIDDYGESLYQGLSNISAEVSLLDKAVVLAPEGQHVVFAAHFLIARECREEWDKKLANFDETADPLGFMLDVSGPWPPYHFSRLINEEETMGG